MSNLSVSNQTTPYQSLLNSKPAEFVKDNKVLSGAAAVATGVVLKHAADHSSLAATAIKKGAVPLASLGVAAAGAAMVHDALSSDAERSTGAKILQGAAGGAMTLAGVEVAGRAYGVSPLGSAAKAVANVVPKNVLLGAAATAPGLAATAWGVADMKDKGVTLGNAAAVGLGSMQASFYGASIALENAPALVQKAGAKGVGVVATAGLGLGAYALGKEAMSNLKDESWGKTAAYATGSAVVGLAGAHVLAKTLGAPGLEKVAQAAIKNPLLVGSVAVLGVTAGAYALYNQKDK